MGFSISWLGYYGVCKTDLLALAGLRDTQIRGFAIGKLFSCAELPTGWSILVADNYDWASPERVDVASANHAVLSCQVAEGSMDCASRMHVRGTRIWSVTHTSDRGRYDLVTFGKLPTELAKLRAEMEGRQQQADVEGEPIDYIFEIPIRLAAAICGFKHDSSRFSDLFTLATVP